MYNDSQQVDDSTFSNYGEVKGTNYTFELTLDFDKKEISGNVTIDF